MNTIKNLMREGKITRHANPENPAEVTEEMTVRKQLRQILNGEFTVDGWSVKLTTDVRVGGHSATTLFAWRWAK